MTESGNARKQRLSTAARWFFTILPAAAIDISLLILIVTGYELLMSRGAFDTVFFPYLTGIGLCISMASVMFGYARAVGGGEHDPEREFLIFVGELFLHASVCFVIALLLSWLISHLYGWGAGIPYANAIVIALFSIGQVFLVIAAVNVHRAFMKLELHLRHKALRARESAG